MKRVVVLGESEFTLGFELAGVDKSFELSKSHPEQTISELMNNDEVGLIIIRQEIIDKLPENLKEKISQSIQPLFLVISKQDTNEELRRLIKKSIGVDLWNK